MKQALLIIDMQRGLFAEGPEPFESSQVISRINDLAARARSAGAPVVFIEHERVGSPVEYGSDGWLLLPGLTAAATDHHIRKTTPDSFLRTDLQGLLSTLGVEGLVICGYASEFCVDTTIRRAAALGYPVLIASDAHTTRDKPHATAVQIREHHNATLPEITSFGSRITAVPSADVVFDVWV